MSEVQSIEAGAKLEGIGQIAIYVTDLARSKEFYG
jgi:hypothetical protein